MFTLQDIQAFEKLQDRLETAIEKTALEFYKITNGRDLNQARGNGYAQPSYGLHKWERFGDIISTTLFWCHGGGGETEYIRFPVAYLGDPSWQDSLRIEMEMKRMDQAEHDLEKARAEAAKRETEERETFERLKQKFGG